MKSFSWRKILHPWAKSLEGAPVKTILLPALVMVATGLICWYLSGLYHQNLINRRRSEIRRDIDNIASVLTSRINTRFAALNGLAAMMKIHQASNLSEEYFSIFAQELKANDPAVRAIEFFPTEGRLFLYPFGGNESHAENTLDDLRNSQNDDIRADVERAIASRQITLSDPYLMVQGGKGVMASLAVYDNDHFLGLAVIVLDQAGLLDIPGISPPEPGIQFSLEDSHGRVFLGEDRVFFLDPVMATIYLPEGKWTLAAIPENGWEGSLSSAMVPVWGLAALLVLLSGHFSFFIFNNQLLLKRTVNERTAALIESETRYIQTFKVINDGIWDCDIENRTGFASDNFFTILGNTDKKFAGFSDWLPYIHPDDRERVNLQIQQSIESGASFNIQTRLVSGNTDPVIVLIRGRVIGRQSNGKAGRMLGTISDITEQMKAQDSLRESEEKFRAIFNNNHAVMLLIDPESLKIIDANPAACTFYGFSHPDFISKDVSVLSLRNPDQLKEEITREVSSSDLRFISQHRLSDGQMRDVEVFSGPIYHNGRKILFSIIHDITTRLEAEKTLRENENRLRFALEGANDGLWDFNMKTEEMYISPRGCELLGYSQTDLSGTSKNWSTFVHPDDISETARLLEEHLNGKSEVFQVEHRLATKSGAWKWVLSRGKLIDRDSEGKPLRMTGTHTDISQRKQATERMESVQRELQRLLEEADASRQVLLSMLEDQKRIEEKLSQTNASLEQRVRERTLQLETINNELEAFSYSVSHDLRAPLRGIDGWSLALLEDYGDAMDEKAHVYLNRVRAEAQRMGNLIDDLLRLSRVTRMELKKTEVDLSDMALNIFERLKEEFKENPPVFTAQPGIKACGDTHLLEIVLTNLLSNACKFSSKQSEPRIEFGRIQIGDQTAYFVRDNGVGFDNANAKKLFGAFQRMHKVSEFPGSGIGLATVKRVINRHGGQVWADAYINQGATFFFTLPEA